MGFGGAFWVLFVAEDKMYPAGGSPRGERIATSLHAMTLP